MTRRRRSGWLLCGAIGLFGAMASLDYVVPEGSWYADHPMTGAALTSFIAFVAAGLLLDGWLKEQEVRRLARISTVAYRSLAQFANDAGRMLLAPLDGADLYALGLPAASATDAVAARRRLTSRGFTPTFGETTGSWRAHRALLEPVLVGLLHDSGFVGEMFRTTAVARRRLQEATALWAPVMLTSPASADDLGRLER